MVVAYTTHRLVSGLVLEVEACTEHMLVVGLVLSLNIYHYNHNNHNPTQQLFHFSYMAQ